MLESGDIFAAFCPPLIGCGKHAGVRKSFNTTVTPSRWPDSQGISCHLHSSWGIFICKLGYIVITIIY